MRDHAFHGLDDSRLGTLFDTPLAGTAQTDPEAVEKMTSMPADQIGQPERGRIAEGMFADIVVFDAETIEDRATFAEPHQYAVGVRHLLVNGEPVIADWAYTGATPGVVLKGPARPGRVRR